MLRSAGTSFIIVTAPGETSLREAMHLHAELREQSMPFAGFVVNRVLQRPLALDAAHAADADGAQLRDRLWTAGLEPRVAARLLEATQRLDHLVDADAMQIEALHRQGGSRTFTTVAAQREVELHTLAELRDLGQVLLSAQRPDVVSF
jgi:anion-transporting  ArsA/GET3 family ATPase